MWNFGIQKSNESNKSIPLAWLGVKRPGGSIVRLRRESHTSTPQWAGDPTADRFCPDYRQVFFFKKSVEAFKLILSFLQIH